MACSVFRLRGTNARDALKCHNDGEGEMKRSFDPMPEKRVPLNNDHLTASIRNFKAKVA
jgi:hypothetical protein